MAVANLVEELASFLAFLNLPISHIGACNLLIGPHPRHAP